MSSSLLIKNAALAAAQGSLSAVNKKLGVYWLRRKLIENGIISKDIADTKGAKIALQTIFPLLLMGAARFTPGSSLESTREFISSQMKNILNADLEREAEEFLMLVMPRMLEQAAVFVLGPAERMKALEEGDDTAFED